MRNINVCCNVLRKVNYLSKGNVFNSAKVVNQSAFKLKNSDLINTQKRFAHNEHHHDPSSNQKSYILYSLLGASLFGLIYSGSNIYQNSAKTAKNLTSSSQESSSSDDSSSTSSDTSSEAAAEETEEKEVVVEETKVEVKPSAKREETMERKTPEKSIVEEKTSNKEKFLPDIPSYAQYLIIGGGTAAMAAFKSIRANDPTAKILVITEESYKPYMRPPLSKDLWYTDDDELVSQLRFKQWNGNDRSIYFLDEEFYVEPKYLNEQENGGVGVVTNKKVVFVDAKTKSVKLDNGWEISFDKCLIATGGRPRSLEVFEKSEQVKEKVTLFRTIDDFKKLQAIAKQGKTIAIVGGGFLGSELACALGNYSKKSGGKVVQIFPEQGNLGKVLPLYLSQWTTKKITDEGVNVIPNATVESARLDEEKIILTLKASTSKTNTPKSNWVVADHVVVAVGLEPNVELANVSGFEVDPRLGGYLVNAELQARNSIWVAGDAACFYDIKLGRRRVEHHDHAVVSGRLAGENMTGAAKPYWHQSMFWSDLGPKLGFEAIGLVDSSLQTMGIFAAAESTDTPQALVSESNEGIRSDVPTNANEVVNTESGTIARLPADSDQYGKGVIFYLRNNTVVGILMWNVFKRMPIARKILSEQEKINDYQEIAKLFQINYTGTDEQEEK